MKLNTLILAAAMVMLSGGMAHANCDDIDLNGKYRLKDDYRRKANADVVIVQKGCQVEVRDIFEKAVWSFDLTGNFATNVPQKILNNITPNSPEETLGLRSLESATFRTELEANSGMIKLVGQMHLPEVPGINKFDVDVVGSGQLSLSGKGGMMTFPGKNKIYSINFWPGKVKLVHVNSNYLRGPLETAFLAGANYILEKVSIGQFFERLISMERIEK